MPTLFVSFNAAGCGHYDYVSMENVQSMPEKQQEKETNKKNSKHPNVSCSCGVRVHYQILATTSSAHTLEGVSVLRLELVAMAIVHSEDVQIHLGNVKLLLPRWSVHRENGESLIFKTPANLTHKPTWMQKENRYEMEH